MGDNNGRINRGPDEGPSAAACAASDIRPAVLPVAVVLPITIVFPVVVAGVDPIVAVVVVGRFACRRRGLAEVLRMR